MIISAPMLCNNKNEQTIATCNNMDHSYKHDVEPKKPGIKSYILYNSI